MKAQRALMLATVAATLLASASALGSIETVYRPRANGQADPVICVDRKTNLERACPDSVLLLEAISKDVATPYQQGEFATLEATFARWRDGGTQFGDGSWELALFLPGLESAFTTVAADTAKLALWKQRYPDSTAALLAEAAMWTTHAARVLGRDPHVAPPKEASAIAAERLAKASALLQQLRKRMADSPAWHELRVTVLLRQGADPGARAAFDGARRRFPRYHPLYFRMSEAYSGAAFDAFAQRAQQLTAQFEGRGMYARLYRQVDHAAAMAFDPHHAPFPRWPLLRDAYEDLSQRYPDSVELATSYASLACRADDGETYRRMRSRADAHLIPARFAVIPVEACDRRHGWSASE